MGKLIINGGKRLQGELSLQGSKNAVLPVMAAAALCTGGSSASSTGTASRTGKITLTNCPVISDRFCAGRILSSLGARVTGSGNTCLIDPTYIDNSVIESSLMRSMRSSVIFMGALLGRTGHCTLCYPGGCDLGPRPIDMHLSSLRKMGAVIEDEHGKIECTAPKGLSGCRISLSFPSVGATENIMLAAATAQGETIISNAAREPEICCLADFLRLCGGKISGDGGGRIVISGVEKLTFPEDEEFPIIPDRIAAATYLSAVACTGGELLLTDCNPVHLEAVIPVFEQMGCYVRCFGSSMYIHRRERVKPAETIRTMVYPGFPTDTQAVVMSPLCTASGTTVFVENIFENRYRHTDALCRMGADIRAEGKVAVVTGVKELYGTTADAPDLRGGAAIVCAALGANGTSEIYRTEYIDRGYEDIDGNLRSLGADITRG